MDGYSAGVVKEKLDNHDKRLESHHNAIGVLEVKMADAEASLEVAKATRKRIEKDTAKAIELAEGAAGKAAERIDKMATTFRNWALFLIAAMTLIWTIVKGLTG